MSHPTIAIIFNGPPRCGKDTLGRLIGQYLSGPQCMQSFKAELFRCVMNRMEPAFKELIPLEWWGSDDYDERKDDPDFQIPMADGFTGTAREVLIYVSEKRIKPNCGQDYFGKQVAQRLQPGYNIITDGGFAPEVMPILAVADYTIILRLERDGYTFNGDSRRYIDATQLPGATSLSINIRDELPAVTAQRLGKRLAGWETEYSITSERMREMRRIFSSASVETFS